jgi:hypothetical protein
MLRLPCAEITGEAAITKAIDVFKISGDARS